MSRVLRGNVISCALAVGVMLAPVARAGAADEPSSSSAASSSTLEERMRQPITADFQEVDFSAAIDFLAESSGVNVVLSEKARAIGRPVTIHLVGMPLSRALNHLLKGQGLLSRQDGETIWVATRDDMEGEPPQTRVWFLKQGPGMYASFETMADTRESVALQPTKVREIRTIKDILSEVVPEVNGSTMLLDERSGALIVTHAPYYLQQIDALLEQLDVTPLQVLIEARFLEITLTDTKEWGFDAELTGDVALSKRRQGDGSKGAGLQLASQGPILRRGTKTAFNDFANQASGNALNLTFQGILTGTQYQAVLHALAENKKTKTLSAPRVTTLNNQTASIKIVTEYVYATHYQPTVVREDLNSNGTFTDVVNGKRETRFVNVPQDFVTKDLGILLHVTPSVGHDIRTITLALKPEVSEKKTDDSFGGEVVLPRFTARNLETSVVIDDGETVMLGGLMKDTTEKTVTRVPVLGSLPLIGPLFRKNNDTAERSNLLIFVTARILNKASAAPLLARTD